MVHIAFDTKQESGAVWNNYVMKNIQAFSRKNLLASAPALRKRYTKETLNAEALSVSKDIQSHNFEFDALSSKVSNDKQTYFFSSLASKLVESKVNDNLKRGYSVRHNDRNVTVSQIKTLLSEGSPFHIIKLDIKEFFESIDRQWIVNYICSDLLVSSESQWLLRKIDKHLAKQNIEGLPRGLSISSTLSEIALSGFDSYIRSLPGVYYYSRYVDDILIFCFDNKNDIVEKAKIKLSKLDGKKGLEFNDKKYDEISVQCICKALCTCKSASCRCKDKCKCKDHEGETKKLQYLGYKFLFTNTPGGKKPKHVEIDIA